MVINVPFPEPPAVPRWLHFWALLTVAATFVLLTLGAIVTTFHVGMADPIWPTYPWHLLLISWEEPQPGFLIEHSHRLAGYIIGCCIIVLTVGLWLREPRPWVRWLGVTALAGVIVQGLLGGFRVKLDSILGPNLALIHGCFAQVVLALLVSLALCTSRNWRTRFSTQTTPDEVLRLRRGSLLVTGLVFLQIIFGALLRHTYSSVGQRGHLLVAFAVVVAVVWLGKEIRDRSARDKSLTVPMTMLAILVGAQLFLGVEAWMLKYAVSSSMMAQAVVRTVHVLMGSLILATAVVVMLQSHREALPATPAASAGHLEGAA